MHIYNKNLRIIYHKIRFKFSKNEFDKSSDLDTDAMEVMNKEELKKYTSDVFKRQQIAHEKDQRSSQ